jgi:hypothetical protein
MRLGWLTSRTNMTVGGIPIVQNSQFQPRAFFRIINLVHTRPPAGTLSPLMGIFGRVPYPSPFRHRRVRCPYRTLRERKPLDPRSTERRAR